MSTPEYSRRMHRVLDHIDANLSMPLDLDTLADVAHFSRYHFHRVFSAWCGETLGTYLRRRRLETAAILLSSGRQVSIFELAIAVGFSSGEAFARAFKEHFGTTPSAWRTDAPAKHAAALAAIKLRRQRNSNLDQANRNVDQSAIDSATHDVASFIPVHEAKMHVDIVQLPPVRVAYLRYIGPYGESLGTFWRETFFPWAAAHDLTAQTVYGVGHDNPDVTPPEKCRYDACSEVPDDFVASGAAGMMTLPGGKYALAGFRGTGATIGDAWVEMFRGWLPGSGYQCDARPCFERYPVGARYDPATGEFDCELCIPVRPL